MAKNVGPGDAIFVPSFTFAATAEVVFWVGATLVFIDYLEDTYNMDPKSLDQGINQAKKLGLKPADIIPVDFFGQPADYNAIQAIADEYGLWVMADGGQSFGASYKGHKVGNIGDIVQQTFSRRNLLVATVMAVKYLPTVRAWQLLLNLYAYMGKDLISTTTCALA